MTDNTADTKILEGDTFDAFRPILGRIAHDFNNLLTPLLAYPSLLRNYIEADSQGHELIDAIDKASRDMIHINEQLMMLSSRGLPDDEETPIPQLIESVIALISSEIDLSNVRIIRDMNDDLPPVRLSVPHLSKALHSLLMNAFESGNENVCITVSAKQLHISSASAAQYDAPHAGDYLQICIADNGTGFETDILPVAKVPFVTTKKENRRRGSGLGLSIASLVTKDHGGFLHLANNPAGGASASIFLPVTNNQAEVDDNAAPGRSGVDMAGIEPRNTKRILIVDDEETIRKLFRMIISSALPDCEVETAANGKEALDLFSYHHHGCLVMDLHMPVMDGQNAFQEIVSLANDKGWEPPAVVFCTGFAPPDMVSRIVQDNSLHCLLSKPVRGEILVDAIKRRIS